MTPILVTAKQAGEILALSTTVIYDLAAKGKLEKKYVGEKGSRNFRLTYASVVAYADSLDSDPVPS